MEKVVVEFEAKTDKAIDDVKKLNKELDNTSKSSKDASDSLNNASTSLDNSSDSAKKLASSFEEVKDNGGAIAILDSLTGGLATRVRDAYEATKLFNFSLKGTKKALIASGVGALVVLLGTVVAYWDDITNLIEGVNRKLKFQEENLQEQLKTQTLQLDLLKQQIAIEELRNGFSPKLTAEYKKQLLIQREQNIALLENLQTQLDIEESKNKEVTLWEKTKIAASGQLGFGFQMEQIVKATNKNSEKSIEIQEKLNEAKKKTGEIDLTLAQIDKDAADRKKESQDKAKEKEKQNSDKKLKDEKETADAIERIRKGLIDTEDERRKEELRKIKLDYDEQIKLAEKYYGKESQTVLDLRYAQKNALKEQQLKFDEQDAERQKVLKQKREDRLKKIKEAADEEIRIARGLTEQKRKIQEANLNNIQAGFALLGQIAGNNKALQAAALIGESAAGIAKTIIQTQTSNAATIAQGAALAIPTGGASVALATKLVAANKISAGISIAANIAATAKGLSALKGGGSAPSPSRNPSASGGGGGGAAASLPPAFNVVGSSNASQLSDAIAGQTTAQSKAPIKTYVVASDVTTAQSLDRNIVDNASL